MCAVLLSCPSPCSKPEPFVPFSCLYMHGFRIHRMLLRREQHNPQSPINMNISCNALVNTQFFDLETRSHPFSASIRHYVCIWLWHPGGQNLLSFGSARQTNRSFDAKFSSSICRKYYFNYCVCAMCELCVFPVPYFRLCTCWTNFANTYTHQIDSKYPINSCEKHHHSDCVRNNQIKIVNDYFKSGVKEPGLEFGAFLHSRAQESVKGQRQSERNTLTTDELNTIFIKYLRRGMKLKFIRFCLWIF